MASTIHQENVSCCEYSHVTSFTQILFQTTSAELQISYGLENNDSLKVHNQPYSSETDCEVLYSSVFCEDYSVLQGELDQRYLLLQQEKGWSKERH